MSDVQFGIMLIMNLGIGSVTPPVGSCLFVGCGVGKVKIEGDRWLSGGSLQRVENGESYRSVFDLGRVKNIGEIKFSGEGEIKCWMCVCWGQAG